MSRKALGPATLRVVQAVTALPESPWVVACSGGADSLVLAWAAGYVGRRRGTPVRAIVVDHGLQPGSDAVAASVIDTLGGLGLEARIARVTVPDDGAGPEASAREARYSALESACQQSEWVLLGHTLDDQAETVLLGLARGSGARSLAGMPAERGRFVRPLLGVTRETTRAACAELGLTPWGDPHNEDPRFTRVRVRTIVLPTLERELGPGVREALARTASLLRTDADTLDALAADTLQQTQGADADTLDCRWLAGLEPAIRDRVLRSWLLGRGASEINSTHLDAVAALVTNWHGQRAVHVPGLTVGRRDGRLTAGERAARSR